MSSKKCIGCEQGGLMMQWQYEPKNVERAPSLKIAENLRMLRNYNQITQREIAELLQIERSTYTSYETRTTHPSLPTLMRLALIYNVTTDFLLGMPLRGDNKVYKRRN